MNDVWDELQNLKDIDQMFDLAIVGAYMRGKLNGQVPVDESRLVFESIKKLLRKRNLKR